MNEYLASDAMFTRLGRDLPDAPAPQLWWSGSGIRVQCACTALFLEIEAFSTEHTPWMVVLAEDTPIARFPLRKGRYTYPILTGMDLAFPHEISILRDTQPTFDEDAPVMLHTLHTDGTLASPQKRPWLIEYLGDSLTVGEGTVGPHSAMEWRMTFMSHAFAFPSLSAEALHADKRIVALSGWGVWRGWDGDATHRIGLVYDRLCMPTTGGDLPCPSTLPQADVVVINLGTNDSNAIKSVSNTAQAEHEITACAMDLLLQAHQKNPHAQILWAYGFCGNALERPLMEAVERVRTEHFSTVHYLSLSDCNGHVGSRMHPSFEAHRIAARELTQKIQEILPENPMSASAKA